MEKQAQELLAKLHLALRKCQQADGRIQQQVEEMYEAQGHRVDEYRRLIEKNGGLLPEHLAAEYMDELQDNTHLAQQRGAWGVER